MFSVAPLASAAEKLAQMVSGRWKFTLCSGTWTIASARLTLNCAIYHMRKYFVSPLLAFCHFHHFHLAIFRFSMSPRPDQTIAGLVWISAVLLVISGPVPQKGYRFGWVCLCFWLFCLWGSWGIFRVSYSYSWLVHVSWPATITVQLNNWTTKGPKESDVRSLALRFQLWISAAHNRIWVTFLGQCLCLNPNGTGPWSRPERTRKFSVFFLGLRNNYQVAGVRSKDTPGNLCCRVGRLTMQMSYRFYDAN